MIHATARDSSDPAMLLDRRELLALLGAGALAALVDGALFGAAAPKNQAGGVQPNDEPLGWDPATGQFVLPPLPYPYEALEPGIDAETMRLHHDLHHAGYVRGLNAALAQLRQVRDGSRPASEVRAISRDLAFNGSGHLLHVLFWNSMAPLKPARPTAPGAALATRLRRDFGSVEAFQAQFVAAAVSVEGGGWALLVLEPISNRLMVMQTEKHQDLAVIGGPAAVRPLLACDVWEHAYYLRYQNRRPEYVQAFMTLIDWEGLERRLANA